MCLRRSLLFFSRCCAASSQFEPNHRLAAAFLVCRWAWGSLLGLCADGGGHV